MSSLASEIGQARAAGHSDQDILTAIQGYAPQYSDDIAQAAKAGHNPTDIVNAVSGYDSENGPEAQRSTLDKLTAPFRYGAAQMAQGVADTLDATGQGGTTSNALSSTAKALAPANYTPAHVTLNPSTWGDIPKAIAESSPSFAEDAAAGGAGAATGATIGTGLGALGFALGPEVGIPSTAFGRAAGGVIGGGLGAIGSYASRNFGDDATRAAVARTGDPNAVPSTEDFAKAMAASAVGGIASRLGFKGALGAPVKAAEGSFASQLIPQVAKGAALDAATGAASTAANQALISGQVDPNAVGGAAVTGAAGGAALRSLASIKDLTAASRFNGLTPQDALPVAQKLVAVDRANGYDGTADSPQRSYDAITKVRDDLGVQADYLANNPNVTKHLDAIREADQSDTTRQTLARVQSDIAASRTPAPTDIQQLSDTLGAFPHGSDLVNTLQHQAVVNRIIGLGNLNKRAGTFTGGITSKPLVQSALNPLSPGAEMLEAGGALLGGAGHALADISSLPHAIAGGLALPAAQAATYAGLRGTDTFTGSRSPTAQFLGRFGDGTTGIGPTAAPSGPRAPAFLDVVADAKAAQKVAQVAQKGSDAAASAPTETALQLADILRTSRMMKASDTVEARRQSAIASGIKRQSSLMASSQSGPVSDATTIIRAAKLRDNLAKQSTPSAFPQASTTTDSLEPASPMRLSAEQARAAFNQLGTNLRSIDPAKFAHSASGVNGAVIPQPIADALGLPSAAMVASVRRSIAAAQVIHKVAAPVAAAPAGPPSTPIVHQDGMRQQVNGEIRNKLSSVQNGVHTRADARRDIVTAAQSLPLSAAGHEALKANSDEVLRQVFRVSQMVHARGLVEEHLDKLSDADAQMIRRHLLRHVDPATGHTFYSTWE